MCSVSINAGSIVATPIGGGVIAVTISGTVANCSSNQIDVAVDCGGPSGRAFATVTGNTWTATVQCRCPCGPANVVITAKCTNPSSCSASIGATLICTCCPDIPSGTPCVEFDASGFANVTWRTYVTVPSGCFPVTVQRDFGDGTLAPPKTFFAGNSGPQTYYFVTHAYAPGHTRVSTVNVLTPNNCRSSQQTIVLDPAPPCATKPFANFFCRLLYFLTLFFAAIAIILGVIQICGCTGNSNISATAIGATVAALVYGAIVYVFCRDCICRFWIKLLGQLLLVLGILVCVFVIPPTCVVLLFTSNQMAFKIGVAIALEFFGFLALYYLWYVQSCCPVTICDFWNAVVTAMMVAFAAAIFVYLVVQPGGASAFGLVLALIVANFISNFASMMLNAAVNANKC